jgi:hypothetical protein
LTTRELTPERRAALLDVREKLLSSPPGNDIDAIIYKTLDRLGSDRFLRVLRTVTYSVDGEADDRSESSIVLGAAPGTVGYITPSGETVYWDGKEPDFWDCWWRVPPYTTDFDTAVFLMRVNLGFGRTVVLEETEEWIRKDENTEDEHVEVRPIFCAEIRDTEGRKVRGPGVGGSAVAVLVAMLDYLFAVADEPDRGK